MALRHVDTVPIAARPLVALYGYSVALALLAYYTAQRLTIRITIEGAEFVEPDHPYIFCIWHGSVPLAFQWCAPRLASVLNHRPHASMQHPSWYMKPIHVLLRLIGVRAIVLGSSGHEGHRAADELVTYLRAGYSTLLAPDGPHGPTRVLKRGVLHVAAQSGVPIVPLRLHASRTIQIASWDRKQMPVPGSSIRVHIGPPIRVEAATMAEAERDLIAALG